MDLSELKVELGPGPLIVDEPEALTLVELEAFKAAPSRDATKSKMRRITERHHALARLLVSGVKPTHAAIITGYSIGTVRALDDDPAFAELLEFYRADVKDAYMEMHSQLAGIGMDALMELRRRLDEEPDKLGAQFLLDIVKSMADRTGNGPASKSVKEVNVNIGIADRMAEARKRATAAAIEAEARDITPGVGGD